MITMTRTIAEQSRHDDALRGVVSGAVLAIARGDDLSDDWRASHPLDDPTIPADLWIHDAARVWIKRDEHEPYEPTDGRCGWCGEPHAGTSVIYTIMRPEDY